VHAAGCSTSRFAVVAGVPVVASVSAPSSLAVDRTRHARITLAGFARGDRFTLYASPERVRG
jgi:FdhD protein